MKAGCAGRVRRACIRALGRAGDRAAVEFLLGERRYPGLDVSALARIAARDVAPLEPDLRRFAGLGAQRRRRLLLALRKAGNPDAVPPLADLAERTRDARVHEALEELQGTAGG